MADLSAIEKRSVGKRGIRPQGVWVWGPLFLLGWFFLVSTFASSWFAYRAGYQKTITPYDHHMGPMIAYRHWGIYPPYNIAIWDLYLNDQDAARPLLSTVNTFWVLGLLSGIPLLYLLTIYRGKESHLEDVLGSARFAKPFEILRSGLVKKSGVVLGRASVPSLSFLFFALPGLRKTVTLRHDGEQHVLLVGPSRSGKGTGVIIPTLLEWGESVVTLDIKKENWRITSGYRQEKGHHVLLFDPGTHPVDAPWCARWNPFEEIRRPHLIKDCQNIVAMIVNTDDDVKGEDHWTRTGRALLTGTLLYLYLINHAKEVSPNPAPLEMYELSMAGMIKILTKPGQKISELMNLFLAIETMTFVSKQANDPFPEWVRIAQANISSQAQEVLNKAPAELSGVLSTGLSFLQLYRDPAVAANISSSTFRIEDLVHGYAPDRAQGKTTPISLYLAVTPSDQDRMRPLLRLFFNMVIRNLMEDLPSPEDWENRLKLLLMIDEFPALKYMSVFKETLGYAAGFGIKVVLIAQDFVQIEDSYKRADIITTHCEVQLALAPTNQATAELLSKTLGKTTVNSVRSNYSGHRMNPILMGTMTSNQESARDLMTPDEIKLMDGILIYFRKSRPIMGEQIVYYTDSRYRHKILPPPDVAREKYPLWFPPKPTPPPPPPSPASETKGSGNPTTTSPPEAPKSSKDSPSSAKTTPSKENEEPAEPRFTSSKEAVDNQEWGFDHEDVDAPPPADIKPPGKNVFTKIDHAIESDKSGPLIDEGEEEEENDPQEFVKANMEESVTGQKSSFFQDVKTEVAIEVAENGFVNKTLAAQTKEDDVAIEKNGERETLETHAAPTQQEKTSDQDPFLDSVLDPSSTVDNGGMSDHVFPEVQEQEKK